MAGGARIRRWSWTLLAAAVGTGLLAMIMPAPVASAATALAGRIIVLNPEEGGSSSGGVSGGVEEKTINLATTLDVGALLTQAGARVIYTRTSDVTVSLAARAALANQVHAAAFVTIAANALNDPSVSGSTTFYGPSGGYVGGQTRPSGLVAESRDLAQDVQAGVIQATGEVDRGVQSADFYVLGYANMPAILIETGFMTNPPELQRLITPIYQQTIAEGIASGLEQFFSGKPPATAHGAALAPLTPDGTYVSDVTLPDHTVVTAGQTLTKVWQVSNSGTAPWDNTYRLVLQPGATIQAPSSVPLPSVPPGQTVELSAPFTVPNTSGNAIGTWRLTTPDGQSFGDPLWVILDVSGTAFSPFWVETTEATTLWSDATLSASALQKLGQWSYLQVTGPQQGSRLPVTEPGTKATGFVDAGVVGPSGAPPAGYTPPPVTPPFVPFWVETTQTTALYSGPSDPAVTFGVLAQWSPLLVLAPQTGQRLYVRNPATNGTAFVAATAVGPSGPPDAAPAAQSASLAVPAPSQPSGNAPAYVIRPGDTLFSIARAFGVSASAIAEANGITNANAIVAGQTLEIPGGTPPFTPFWIENFVKTPLWSGSDNKAEQFSLAKPFTPMQALAPATNGRYLVRVWTTGGVAYVDAGAVGPAGAPQGAAAK